MSFARSAVALALSVSICGGLLACNGASDATGDVGVDAVADVVAATPPFCSGATAQLYDPIAGAELELFPDDFYTRVDGDSPTGLRLDFSPAIAPWIDGIADLLRGTFDGLDGLSGFGTNAGLVFRFDGPVGSLPSPPSSRPTASTTPSRARRLRWPASWSPRGSPWSRWTPSTMDATPPPQPSRGANTRWPSWASICRR